MRNPPRNRVVLFRVNVKEYEELYTLACDAKMNMSEFMRTSMMRLVNRPDPLDARLDRIERAIAKLAK